MISWSSRLIFFGLFLETASGFLAPPLASVLGASKTTRLFETASLSKAEEAAQRAAASAAAMKPVPQPKLFEDDLLEDMRQSLLKLERRVQEGPGAISVLEVEEFECATRRILEEMKRNEHNRPKPAPAFPLDETAVVPPAAAPPAPASASAPTAAVVEASEVAVVDPVVETTKPKVMDTSMDEGPAYEGEGGMGLAKGTANTYVIPGMDEMSGEEYRAALQKTISDRQARRIRESGVYGNVRANDYLNTLGGAGTAKKRWDPREEDAKQQDKKDSEPSMPFKMRKIERPEEI